VRSAAWRLNAQHSLQYDYVPPLAMPCISVVAVAVPVARAWQSQCCISTVCSAVCSVVALYVALYVAL
jgi:hypothetical protein